MADTIVRHLPFLLLAAGVLILLLTGRPIFGSGALSAKQSSFKSLASASPVLAVLISISVIGKPFLDYLQKNDWQSDILSPIWLQVVVTLFVASLYATIGAILFFFYRAIRNINFFCGRRVRAPYSALFMVVPIVNLVIIPYVQYFVYRRSRSFAWPQRASALGAAALVSGAFGLLLISVICGYAGSENAEGGVYDAAGLMAIGTLTGLAGAILQVRLVDGVKRAQQAYALRLGAIDATEGIAEPESRLRTALQGLAVAILVVLAVVAAFNPPLASRAWQPLLQLLKGA